MEHESKKFVSAPIAVTYARIHDADNGYIVEWSEKHSKPGSGPLDHCDYIERNHLFTLEEADKAWAKFRELKEAEWAYEKKRH